MSRLAGPLHRNDPTAPAARRIVHLGIGAFARAHLAWYTAHAGDADQWSISAFTGRSNDLAERLSAQDGLYTLIERRVGGNHYEVVPTVHEVFAGDRVDLLVDRIRQQTTAVVTSTITEAGYRLAPDGRPNLGDEMLRDDLERLRAALLDPSVPAPRTVLCRLLLGLDARRRTHGAPLAIVPCDNVPDNGNFVRRGLLELADTCSPPLADWIATQVDFVSTSVDRITPRLTGSEVDEVERATGRLDRAPVVTEEYTAWVLSGRFRAGRPAWETSGAQFVDDLAPYESRKLWMLNGAHTLLAFTGLERGLRTVGEAIDDPTCRQHVDDLWETCARHLPSSLDPAMYARALAERFANPSIRHDLEQIGQDAVAKLRARLVPIVRLERAAGRDGRACAVGFAAWIRAVRTSAAPRDDEAPAIAAAQGEPLQLLRLVDPRLADDSVFAREVLTALSATSSGLPTSI